MIRNRDIATPAAVMLAVLFLFALVPASSADDKEPTHYAQFYGFSGVELYKLDKRAFGLSSGDFDSDGRTDLLAVDNRASCLRLFAQIEDPDKRKQESGQYVNDLRSDWRFDVRQIPVDKQIAGLVAADLNQDDRTDVAYIGTPDRLVVRYQPEKGKSDWTERWSVRLPELAPAAWMIAAGDLNGDQKADLAVLGKNVTYIVYQGDDGEMQTPVPLINTSSQLSLLQVADLNGDNRMDLSYQATEGQERGLCARLQTDDGRLGPEIRFDLQQPRSVTLYDVDQQPGSEIMTVNSRTGRVLVSQMKTGKQTGASVPSRMLQFGVGDASGAKGREVAVGDIDGDKLNDVIVTDPQNAQVLVYRQNGVDGLDTIEAFPGLLGATDICTADTDGDGVQEVIVMSGTEAIVGISRFEEGRLTFPETVATPSDDFTLTAVNAVRTKTGTRLVLCETKGSGRSASVQLRYLQRGKDGAWTDLGEPVKGNAENLGSRGLTLEVVNANADESEDILIVPVGTGNKGVCVVVTPDGDTAPQIGEPRNLGIATAGALFVDGSDLFVARDGFARKMSRKDDDWTVADQFNAGEAKAKISGVAVLDLDGEDGDEVVLVDSGIKKLRVLRKSSGLYRGWKEVELGSARFHTSHVADLDGDGKEDLLLFGQQQFAVLYAGRPESQLQEIASWESERDDAYAADVVAGDLNGDGKVDLTVIDTSIDGVQLLYYDQDAGLKSATHFRVFEEKRLVTQSNSRGTEPREAAIVDVTGDGRSDLVILCHDRLIVYPQDTGATPAESSAGE